MVLSRDDPRLRSALLGILSAGGIAVVPCDTIYGLVGRAPDSEERIRRIKGRSETNPFLMLVGDLEQVSAMSDGPLDQDVTALWPAPLTVVLRTTKGTAAVRLPNDPFLTDIVQSLGAPIYSTSVNRSGSAPMWQIDDIVAEFEEQVDLIADGGDLPAGLPSTILDITQKPYRILRQGDFQVPSELVGRG